eukprot:7531081-Pyramimonas_sp.AAC.1
MLVASSHQNADVISRAAVIEDIVAIVSVSKGSCRGDGILRWHDSALIVERILRDNPFPSVRALSERIKSHVCSLGGDTNRKDAGFDIKLFPNVLWKFTDKIIDQYDIDVVLRRTAYQPSAMSTAQRSRRDLTLPSVAAASQAIVEYETWDHAELVQLIALRDAQLAQSVKEIDRTKRAQRRANDRCDALVVKNTELKQQLDELMRRVNYRVGTRNVSLYGGYTIAIRKSRGHVASSTAVALIAGDEIH